MVADISRARCRLRTPTELQYPAGSTPHDFPGGALLGRLQRARALCAAARAREGEFGYPWMAPYLD